MITDTAESTTSFAALPQLSGARPWVGHLPELNGARMRFLRRIVEDGHDLVRLRTPVGRVLVLNSAERVREALVEKAALLGKSHMMQLVLHPIGGEGLFLSDGALWRRQRKLMAPMFHPSTLEAYTLDMQQLATRAVQNLGEGQTVAFAHEMTRLTMSIAGKTLFDAETLGEADELGRALTVALDWAGNHASGPFAIGHVLARNLTGRLAARARGSAQRVLHATSERLRAPLFFPGHDGRALRDAIAVLDQHVAQMIAQRRQGPHRDDLLARLLEARDEDGRPMPDKQVRDEVLTLFVAGHETTATALAWAMHELCRHPTILAEAEAEVLALGHAPTPSDLPRLPLLLRVFKEAMRLYPPVFLFGRQLHQPTSFGGHAVPAPSVVLVSPYALHRRADVWPDPERFDPDRFLPEAEQSRSRFAWLPFGAGPRVCIGNTFALLEGHMVLATLLYHARFELLAEESPEPVATLRPRGPMRMRVHRRVGV